MRPNKFFIDIVLAPFIERFNQDNNFDVELFVQDEDDENSLKDYDKVADLVYKIRNHVKLQKEFNAAIKAWLDSIEVANTKKLATDKLRAYLSLFDQLLWSRYNPITYGDYNNLGAEAFEDKCNVDFRPPKDPNNYFNYYHDRL